MTVETHPLVFFFDCDNTLLDNDRVRSDLDEYLAHELGAGREAYWRHYEELRDEAGYADYLGAVQRLQSDHPGDPRLAGLSAFLLEYPFADRLYPRALEVIAHCRQWGTTAILSDGDAVFQPRKLQRSGLRDAVEGRTLIYIHKEKMLADVMARYPARHYVMVDDKLSILTAMKAQLRDRLTTIWPRQGHYAVEAAGDADRTPPDMAVDHIADLLHFDFSSLTPEPA
jgi:FMN phosphatase YigB (HAD superfamily)